MWNSRKEAEHDRHGYCPPRTYCTLGKRDKQVVRNYDDADECHDMGGKDIQLWGLNLGCLSDWSLWVSMWASLVAQMVKGLPAGQKTWVRPLGWKIPLEKAMATHSSTFHWRIPGTEEPGGLQSMGHRVRHDWATTTHTHTHTHVISNRQLDGHGWSAKECLSWRERLRKVLGIRAVMKPPEMAEIGQNGTDYTDKKKKKKSSSYQTNKQKTQTSTRENQERSRET